MFQSLFLLSSKHQYLYRSRHVSEFIFTHLEASISLQIKICFRIYFYSAWSINIFTNPDTFQSLFLLSWKHQYLYKSRHSRYVSEFILRCSPSGQISCLSTIVIPLDSEICYNSCLYCEVSHSSGSALKNIISKQTVKELLSDLISHDLFLKKKQYSKK